jgi:hypothetical protein
VFQFDSKKLRSVIVDVTPIELDADQERLVKDITHVIAARIGMDPIPCRGLWLQAIRQWQVEHAKLASTISAMPPASRAEAAREISALFVPLASEMLANPGQLQELSAAVDDAFRLYMQKYNRRRS